MVGKSFISSSGFRLAARAARPVVNTTEVRRKFRRLMPASGGAGFGFGLGAGGGMSVIRFGFNGGGHRSQRVRAGRGLPPRERRRMKIMAVYTLFALGGAQGVIPITTNWPVRAGLPVPIRRAVATAAKSRAVCKFPRIAVTGLQQLQVGFVVAVE